MLAILRWRIQWHSVHSQYWAMSYSNAFPALKGSLQLLCNLCASSASQAFSQTLPTRSSASASCLWIYQLHIVYIKGIIECGVFEVHPHCQSFNPCYSWITFWYTNDRWHPPTAGYLCSHLLIDMQILWLLCACIDLKYHATEWNRGIRGSFYV